MKSATQRYRITAECEFPDSSRLVSELYAELAPIGVQPEHVVIADDGAIGKPVRIEAHVDCDEKQRAVLDAFVRRALGLPWVRSIRCDIEMG